MCTFAITSTQNEQCRVKILKIQFLKLCRHKQKNIFLLKLCEQPILIIMVEIFCIIKCSIHFFILNNNYLLERVGFCHRYDYLDVKENITTPRFLLGEKPAPML